MRVLVIVKATKSSETGQLPSDELLGQMGKFNEELVNAGVMLSGEGLHPSSRGKRIVISGSQRAVVDGPFSETKELVAGFWLWQVRDMDEAIEWARRCPEPMPGEQSVLEIRPVYEAADFADSDPTGKLREQEEALRQRTQSRS